VLFNTVIHGPISTAVALILPLKSGRAALRIAPESSERPWQGQFGASKPFRFLNAERFGTILP